MKIRATFVYEWEVKVSDFDDEETKATPEYVVETLEEQIEDGDVILEEVADLVLIDVEEVK